MRNPYTVAGGSGRKSNGVAGKEQTMSRWIDVDALKKRVEDSNKSAGLHLEDLRKIRRWIKTAPSIDIVRCKECKHYFYDELNDCKMCYIHEYGEIWEDDDFCSYGEVRDE